MKKSAGRPARAGYLAARVVREAWDAAPMTTRRLWGAPRHPLLRIELWEHQREVRPVDVYRLRAGTLVVLCEGAAWLAKYARSEVECGEWVDVCDLLQHALSQRSEIEWYDATRWAAVPLQHAARWETVRRQHAARLARRCSLDTVTGIGWLNIEERSVAFLARRRASGGAP